MMKVHMVSRMRLFLLVNPFFDIQRREEISWGKRKIE